MSPAAPATNWRENVAPDEATRYEDYARIRAGLQSAATQKLGRAGRALHRKGHLGAEASFEVFGNLPERYATGFFAGPGSYRPGANCPGIRPSPTAERSRPPTSRRRSGPFR
jgi:hypothetical protein